MAIKRHNAKTIFRKIRHCFRASRARRNWRNAHCLKMSGIATPAPIAFVEKRWGPLRLGGYYVCAYSDAPMAAEKYQQTVPTEREQNWFVALLKKMRHARIYHGDFNAHNILVTARGMEIIDLDRMQDCTYTSGAIFRHKHRKDRRRFLRDWRHKPQQLKCFTEAFEVSGEGKIPSSMVSAANGGA